MKISDMTVEQKMEAIEWYQNTWQVHELTCRNGHGKLVGERIGTTEVILACEKCYYIERIPSILYLAHHNFREKGVIKS